MSLLENIQTGRENKPPRIMVYGQEGVGKSTLGASAPDPIFIQTEDGLGEIDTCKFPLAQSVGDVLDSHNVRQREIILKRHKEESADCFTGLSESERKEWESNLQKQLEEERLYPDYARKLYLIENCIYGVDVQPIATQISKLRFFISLLCDQLRYNWDPDASNYGLLSLPNLEAKFVCANTLLSLPKVDGGGLALSADGIQDLKEALQKNRHKIFFARTAETKAKYKEKDLNLRDQIKETVRGKLYTPDETIIDIYEKEIETALKEREAVAEPKMAMEEQIVGGDLFTEGEKQWVEVDVNAAPRKKIDDRIKNARRIIAEERNKANLKPTGSTDIEKLAAMVAGWDPYDQNACSDFFDPEWMFNVKNGFDIVIGNPPYIRLQTNGGELADYYKDCGFATFTRTGDIYSLFYERGYQFLHDHGFLCFITSNKWMRAAYGELTRTFFVEHTNPMRLIDFSGQKIFESATVDTNILLISKEPYTGFSLVCQARTGCKEDLSRYIQNNSFSFSFTASSSWAIQSPIEMTIRKKVESLGIPLKDWKISINYGIKTGYNEAFIIDEQKYHELIRSAPKNAEILRPILRGRDIRRYGISFANLYLIATHNGIPNKRVPRVDIRNYPKVKHHLDQYWDIISSRADMGDTPYNLRSCAYMDEFSRPKIIYPNMTKYLPFYYDKCGYVTNQKCFIITGEHIAYLTAFFNSTLFKFCYRDAFPELLGGTRELSKIFFDKIPVKKVSDAENRVFEQLVMDIQNDGKNRKEIEDIVETKIYELYGVTKEEQDYIIKSEEEFYSGEEIEEEKPAKPVKKSVKKPVKKTRRNNNDDDFLD